MQCRKGIMCVGGITVLVSACASYSARVATPTPTPPGPAEMRAAEPRAPEDPLERLIVFAALAPSFPSSVLQSEYTRAQDQHRRAPGAYTRLRLAMLMTCRRAPFHDDRQARKLLAEAAQDAGADQTVRDLATVWLRDLDERMALERALEEERRQRQTLQRKLEQLKIIEEEIDRRPATPVVPPAR